MKKTYSKPTISFENFQMTSSIAGSCAFNDTATTRESCSVDMDGFNIFVSACEFPPLGSDSEICYDVPMDDTRVFGS